MTATVAPNQATLERDAKRARVNYLWIVGSIATYGVWVLVAQIIPATEDKQLTIKPWLALVAVIGSVVQLATISRVYSWSKKIPPGAVSTLSAVHRWSGRTTLAFGGLVTYLCMTGPFAPGFTLHRLLGYIVVSVVLVKVVILRVAERFSGLLPVLGLTAVAGWTACFLTKALVVWFK